jgi:hypothetical protein
MFHSNEIEETLENAWFWSVRHTWMRPFGWTKQLAADFEGAL